MGAKIKQIKYADGADGNPDRGAGEVRRGQMGIGEEYEIIDRAFLDDADLLTFTLRGDANGNADKPGIWKMRVDVRLDDGSVLTAEPEVEVMRSEGSDATRPFVRLPYDNHWGGNPNSQAGFGYVADDGIIPGDKLIIDLVDPLVSNDTPGSVFYQLVHEDGTPSAYTPVPEQLHVTSHKSSSTAHRTPLPPLNLRQKGDKPGYYRFLVWPQSVNSKYSADPSDPDAASQIGSVYYRYSACGGAPASTFTVSPGGPPDVTLTPGGGVGYPGVRLQAMAGETFPDQTVRVSLPRDKKLKFVAESGSTYLLTVQNSQGTMQHHPGSLSADGQTLTFRHVGLLLTGAGREASMWVAVQATGSAPQGTTRLTFQVGGQTSPSSAIHVVPAGA
ncbi:hypothetical protein ACFYNL_27250 [Streptomyces sp. NPDC007808]|uniref:hypothetical protein n=1 Tax=Streptomyces sp. NPDC007808 TaxID=3364779 RepID=UPI00367950E8